MIEHWRRDPDLELVRTADEEVLKITEQTNEMIEYLINSKSEPFEYFDRLTERMEILHLVHRNLATLEELISKEHYEFLKAAEELLK